MKNIKYEIIEYGIEITKKGSHIETLKPVWNLNFVTHLDSLIRIKFTGSNYLSYDVKFRHEWNENPFTEFIRDD